MFVIIFKLVVHSEVKWLRSHCPHQVLSVAEEICILSGSWRKVSQRSAQNIGCSHHPKEENIISLAVPNPTTFFFLLIKLLYISIYDLSSKVEHVSVSIIKRKQNSCGAIQIFFMQRLWQVILHQNWENQLKCQDTFQSVAQYDAKRFLTGSQRTICLWFQAELPVDRSIFNPSMYSTLFALWELLQDTWNNCF